MNLRMRERIGSLNFRTLQNFLSPFIVDLTCSQVNFSVLFIRPIQIIIKMSCRRNHGVFAGRIPKIDIVNWMIFIYDIGITQLCQAISFTVLSSGGILIGIVKSTFPILFDFCHIMSCNMLIN